MPLSFGFFDTESGKAVQFVKVFYRNVDAERWWNIVLIDGGGQHNIGTLFPRLGEHQLKAGAAGYFPVDFRITEKLEPKNPSTHRVALSPRSDVMFTVRGPDGKPAGGAKFEWVSPKGLRSFETFPKIAAADGTLVSKFPPHADVGFVEVRHPAGSARIALSELGEARDLKGKTRKMIPMDVQLAD